MFDMHCHLDFAGNAAELARVAAQCGVGAFSNTVTPRGYLRAQKAFGQTGLPGDGKDAPLRVGLGLHPWWVADGTCGEEDVALFEELASTTPYIGEVGLDFAPRRDGTQKLQLSAFERVVQACADGGKVVSVHAVRAATPVLDVLERTGCCRKNTCILHWFSGTSDELARAVKLGCLFSIGTRMLATRHGRAYARSLPSERLLLETDLPNGPASEFCPQAWKDDLARAEAVLVEVTGRDDLAETVACTSRALLGRRPYQML